MAGILYGILAPIQLGQDDYNNDWNEFQRRNPAGAYAWSVGARHDNLEQSIIALRPVQKFVRVRRFPISTTRGNITREEWLRATIDLFLFRIAGIRDHCLHLVAEVFELGLPPLEVKTKKILSCPEIKAPPLQELIEHVSSVANNLRGERNRRAHEGVQRQLTEEPFFKVLSLMESRSVRGSKLRSANKGRVRVPKDGSIPFQDVRTSDEYDLRAVYVALATRLEKEFVPAGDEMVDAVRSLTDALCEPLCDRLERKRAGDSI
ncbi:MAG: hypothetical protein SFX73_08575 [Kofleriaceae bacterium]|nr:hypothetical protein [Kofleriaceae bacterium]